MSQLDRFRSGNEASLTPPAGETVYSLLHGDKPLHETLVEKISTGEQIVVLYIDYEAALELDLSDHKDSFVLGDDVLRKPERMFREAMGKITDLEALVLKVKERGIERFPPTDEEEADYKLGEHEVSLYGPEGTRSAQVLEEMRSFVAGQLKEGAVADTLKRKYEIVSRLNTPKLRR